MKESTKDKIPFALVGIGVILMLTGAVLFAADNYVRLKRENEWLKTQAVERGYAEWVADGPGPARFQWVKP